MRILAKNWAGQAEPQLSAVYRTRRSRLNALRACSSPNGAVSPKYTAPYAPRISDSREDRIPMSDRQLYGPSRGGGYDRGAPKLRREGEREPGRADPPVQRAAEQGKLDPSGQSRRDGQPATPQRGSMPSSGRQRNRHQIAERGRQGDPDDRVLERRDACRAARSRSRNKAGPAWRRAAHGRACENAPDIDGIGVREAPGLKQSRRDHVAQGQKAGRGGHDEERDLAKPAIEPLAQVLGHSRSSPSALDMTGSSAADTDMPNRLTGSV